MSRVRTFAALAASTAMTVFLFSGSAYAAGDMPAAVKLGETAIGTVLTDAHGMTLYHFGKDAPGTSNCKGGCVKAWPPLQAMGDEPAVGDFTVITRDDGSKQWAHMGFPLYTWMQDKKPGDTTGEGVNDVWHAATP